MIIICEECRTTYQFDETMVDDPRRGFWVRCSRCRYVFFQQLPLNGGTTVDEGDETPVAISSEERWEESASDREAYSAAPPKQRRSNVVWKWLAVLFVCSGVAGALYYFYPKEIDGILRGLASTVPVLSDLMKADAPAPPQTGPAVVKVTDLRQRFVNNWLVGNVRVVEGTAVNTAKHTVTRIKIAATLYNAMDTPLREEVAYCGNILTDQELSVMTEEQIARELAMPQGTDISNDRIDPGASIPFMIVFVKEPPGVVKTLVYPIQAERLLN